MTPTREAPFEQWRSDDVAWIVVGNAAAQPPTTIRCLVMGSSPLSRVAIELEFLTYMGAGKFGELRTGAAIPQAQWTGEPHRYGFYSYKRDERRAVCVVLEMHGSATSGIVLPESVMDTFQYLTATMAPDQLWDIGHTLAITRDYTKDFERGDGNSFLGEYS